MKKFLLFIVLLPVMSFGQLPLISERTYSDTMPAAFKLDYQKLREHIFVGAPASLKKEQLERKVFMFADNSAKSVSEMISSGFVYSDWKELEAYMNAIIDKIMPAELKKDSMIHTYIYQDGSFNAFMVPTGHAFVNIGLLPEVSNEAVIAGILAHELGHYYFKHSLYFFIEQKKGTFREGAIFKNKAANRYSQNHELQADSIAMIWLKRSGYNIKAMIDGFKKMDLLEKNAISKSENYWEMKETTHPSSVKRLKQLNEMLKKYFDKDNPGKYFLVSEEKFRKFQEEVKPEILKNLLNSFSYDACTEKAFKYHLYDPNNALYVHYLLESIRRNCYLDIELWGKLFITENYYDTLMVEGMKRKRKMTDNIFTKINGLVLAMDSADINLIKAKYYWDEKPEKFKTYEDAFNFYYKKSLQLRDPECFLTNALSFSDDTVKMNKLLNIYLSAENIKHRDFAQSLKNGKIYEMLPKKKLLVFEDPGAILRLGDDKNDVFVMKYGLNVKNELACMFDTVSNGMKNVIPVYMPGLKKNNLNEYRMLKFLENFSFTPIVSKGVKTELYILDPFYWEVFLKYGVNEIEFIMTSYTEYRQAEKDISAYRKAMDSDFNSILSKATSTRFVDTYISSVRVINGAVMKIKFYDGQTKVKAKNTGYKDIIADIKEQMKNKAKRAVEIDNFIRDEHR